VQELHDFDRNGLKGIPASSDIEVGSASDFRNV
jgi:hypothetical protein